MTLTEYEDTIKQLVSENKNNPEIYNNLQKMILMFLQRKRVCNCSQDYEDMSYLLAGDIYMMIVKEGITFEHYLGYLDKIYRSYAQKYYKDHSSEFIYYDDSDDFKETVYGPFENYDYDCINNKIYLEEIEKVIDEVLIQSCKYDVDSTSYLNLKLSLILSLLRGDFSSFHLSYEQEFYLKFLITSFKSKVHKGVLI